MIDTRLCLIRLSGVDPDETSDFLNFFPRKLRQIKYAFLIPFQSGQFQLNKG